MSLWSWVRAIPASRYGFVGGAVYRWDLGKVEVPYGEGSAPVEYVRVCSYVYGQCRTTALACDEDGNVLDGKVLAWSDARPVNHGPVLSDLEDLVIEGPCGLQWKLVVAGIFKAAEPGRTRLRTPLHWAARPLPMTPAERMMWLETAAEHEAGEWRRKGNSYQAARCRGEAMGFRMAYSLLPREARL